MDRTQAAAAEAEEKREARLESWWREHRSRRIGKAAPTKPFDELAGEPTIEDVVDVVLPLNRRNSAVGKDAWSLPFSTDRTMLRLI